MIAILFALRTWRGFDAPLRYSSRAVEAVLVRDLDGDGAPDIVASGNQVDELPELSVLRNRGDGTFEPERRIATGLGEKIEDVADLDADGVPDLITSAYWSGGIVVYRGMGSLMFDRGTQYTTATHGGPTRVVDFDRDGTPDVISFSFGSGNPVRVHLFRGNGDATLASKKTFETGVANAATPSLRTFGGGLEIVAGERSGQLAIFRYADGTISVSRIDAGAGFDLASTFADVNGDGIADIVATTDDERDPNESIFVTLAGGDGSFGAARRIAQPRHVGFPIAVRAADFDGDGHADLIVAGVGDANVYFFAGDGSGGFAEAVPVNAGAPVNAFDIADVDGDGCVDLVTANSDRSISVLLNRGPCRVPRGRAVRP
ncbi:MAG TPA: VCBS repeat-containing protein [Thermoanaerobaculia bacterium]|nr:VCBS repeat-containing protein [Thermoanaerobaculia bacterium]